MKTTIGRITRTAMLAVAFMLCATGQAWAVTKPVAIWHRDFTAGARGGYNITANGNTVGTEYITIDGTSGGVIVKNTSVTQNLANYPLGVVARFTGAVYSSSSIRALATTITSASSAGSDRTWFGVNKSTQMQTYYNNSGSPALWTGNRNNYDANHAWPNTDTHYFGCTYSAEDKNGSSGRFGWRSYVDGVLSVWNDGMFSYDTDKSLYGYGFALGGSTTGYQFTDATIDYIAIVRSADPSDIAYWSLTNMTSAETISSAGGNITSGDRSSYGVNLNGGTVNVTDDTTIAALFVQQNTELVFAEGATLTIEGPIYVADNKTLTITSVATISGSQIFITADNVFATSGAIVSSNPSYAAAVTDTTVGLTAYSNEASVSGVVDWSSIVWADGTWHDNSPTTLTLTDDATINFDATYAMPSLTLTGAHAVTLVYTKTPTIPSGVSCENSATCRIKIPATSTDWPLSSAWTVPNDGITYILVGSSDSNSPTTCSGKITVNGKLETTGYFTMSGSNKIATNGELHVLGGKTTMTTGSNDQGICGTLTIENGAEFENVTNDGLHYGGSPTVNVYGTLNMASTRWTLGGATFNFYAGSTITGVGQNNYGALDPNNVKTFNVLACAGYDTVDFSAKLRPRTQPTFNIASGVTVNCTGTVGDYQAQINITGNGKFKIATGASFPANVPFNVTSPATLELAGGTVADAIKGTGNLSVASGTYEPSFSSFTGPISVSGNGTVLTLASSQITASSAITVGTGSTLKIKVTDEVIATGFDASSKVSNSGGTVMFVDSSGTQITENVSQDGETLSPAVKVLYWDGSSWSEQDDFSGYTEASIAVSGATSVTLPASLNLQKMTLTGSSGSLTIVGNNNTLTVGDVIIPNGVTLNAASELTVEGTISGDGSLVIPNGVTFANAAGSTWNIGDSGSTGAVLTVEDGGELVINGTVNLTTHFGGRATGVVVEKDAVLRVNSTGTLYTDDYWEVMQISGSLIITGTVNFRGDAINVLSGGSIDLSGAGTMFSGYGLSNSGTITVPRFAYYVFGGSKFTNNDGGTYVLRPTDSTVGATISNLSSYMDNSGTIMFDASLLTKPTGTASVTLVTISSTSLTLTADSLTGCSADYYVKQDGTTGAVTLQLHAAKDSAGVYYDDIEDAFNAIVADDTLTVTILDGTEASYDDTLASNGLGRNGTQVFHLVAERRALDGSVIAQYPTAQAAVEADSGDSIVAIYETSTVTARVAPFYIKPVGISLDDITINCVYAGFTYDEFTDMSGYGGNFVGLYSVQRHASPATFTWNPEVDEGDWNTVANWTSDDGEVLSAPNNSNYTVILGTAASVNTGTTTLTLGKMEVGAAVSITGQNQSPREFSFAEGIVFTSESSMITLLYSYFADGTVMSTTVPGKYVRFRMPDDYKYYDLVNSAATVYDAEDNVVNGYNSLADAVAAAANGQKVKLFANSSDTVTVNDKSITFIEDSYTFTGSFTGNGTLVLPAGTLLASPSSDMWASGWTGTVWVKGIDNICGTTTDGSTLFEPNKYGREGSVLKLSGIKGWINATSTSSGGFTINPTIEVDNDIYEYGLWLSNGNGYNSNTIYRNHTILKGLKGSGVLKGSDSGGNALLLVNEWDGFTGTLTLANKIVVFGDSLPEAQEHVEGGGFVVVGSGKSVRVPNGKTWTLGNGVVVYEAGNLSLGTGAAIANTTAANTWIKRGTGTITLNALADLPATPANDWTGTVVLPSLTASSGWSLNQYGNSGSTVEILGITGGWISEAGRTVAPKLKLTGGIVIGAMSSWAYSFSEITGGGNLSFATTGSQPSSVTISKVAAGYTGTISSTLTTPVTIGELKLSSLPTCDQKILSVGGTGSISLDISKIKVGESPLPAKYKVERRPEGAEGDGFYVYYYGTIFSVW